MPDRELKEVTETEFFNSALSSEADIGEMQMLIEAIYSRVASRYGIINGLLRDPSVNEIMVNGPCCIFAERNGRIEEIDNAFTSEFELEELIRMFASDVHREINEANPIVDARMPSGYRVNGVLRAVALNGPILTIRKFRDKEISMRELVEYGSISEECATELSTYVRKGFNIFISGGTSTGKTTFLNALSASIDCGDRVVIIEDSAELTLRHLKNCVHMECRMSNSIGRGEVTMSDLIRTSLRMRPDRIIVGEVRGREVVDMIQAMNTGHSGSMSTGHGNSVEGMLARLETMYMTDGPMPVTSIRRQIANAIDIMVHLKRDRDGKRRVTQVVELMGTDDDSYMLRPLYETDEDGRLVRTLENLSDYGETEVYGKQ